MLSSRHEDVRVQVVFIKIMQIKSMSGESYNVTGQGQGNFNSVGAAAGIASFLGLNAGNVLGGRTGWGWGEGCCSDNTPVNRYELNMTREADSLKSENALLRSQVYVDQKLVDVVNDYTSKISALSAEVRANKDAQVAVNMQQAVYNGTNTATLTCMQNSIAALQAITKTYIPSSNVCQSDCCGCCSAQ